ncbi:MAG: 30S ribosomal protein S13 [Chitinivibrionia bacterium]|jgi:small subunit ribosomal protein S13|nr:30S ribosomal protein S13 [Chitinivibrionia bacterium]
MARVAGVDIPDNKRAEIALTYILGIGRPSAQKILDKTGVDRSVRIKDVSEADLDKIRAVIDEEYVIEGNLRTQVRMNVKRLMDIGCYRGERHKKGLPCRGQKTKTNARTRKGKKKTVPNKKK